MTGCLLIIGAVFMFLVMMLTWIIRGIIDISPDILRTAGFVLLGILALKLVSGRRK